MKYKVEIYKNDLHTTLFNISYFFIPDDINKTAKFSEHDDEGNEIKIYIFNMLRYDEFCIEVMDE